VGQVTLDAQFPIQRSFGEALVKVDALSLLIVDENQRMRQVLAAFVSDRYRSVTAAAPDEMARLIGSEPFDVMIAPRTQTKSAKDEVYDSSAAECVGASAAIRSGVTGNIYEFTAINQRASSSVCNPFERIMLQVAIESAELSLRQVNRVTEDGAIF
jgi:hypothetical protein